jgi:hypothetical protein
VDFNCEKTYQRRADEFGAAWKRCAFREQIATHLRVATFLTGVVMFTLGWNNMPGWPWYLAGYVAIGGFFAAVAYHEYVRDQMRRHFVSREINEQAIARLRRNWKALPETRVAVPPQHGAVALDLDLFGHASLFHHDAVGRCPPVIIASLGTSVGPS